MSRTEENRRRRRTPKLRLDQGVSGTDEDARKTPVFLAAYTAGGLLAEMYTDTPEYQHIV